MAWSADEKLIINKSGLSSALTALGRLLPGLCEGDLALLTFYLVGLASFTYLGKGLIYTQIWGDRGTEIPQVPEIAGYF
jgi:hypothetical protein